MRICLIVLVTLLLGACSPSLISLPEPTQIPPAGEVEKSPTEASANTDEPVALAVADLSTRFALDPAGGTVAVHRIPALAGFRAGLSSHRGSLLSTNRTRLPDNPGSRQPGIHLSHRYGQHRHPMHGGRSAILPGHAWRDRRWTNPGCQWIKQRACLRQASFQ